jgi:predicted amidophosphoribosyltransferase
MEWIAALFPPRCAACHRPGDGLCAVCFPPRPPVRRSIGEGISVTALGRYDGSLRAAVLAIKRGRRDVIRSLAVRLNAIIPTETLLVPIPTTHRRRRLRGLDGCIELARAVAGFGETEWLPALRRRGSDAQRGRTRTLRLVARGRFVCSEILHPGMRVALLDDVCTTGATLRDCASVVRAAGAIVASTYVVAVADPGRLVQS